jgi:hypothetical protein
MSIKIRKAYDEMGKGELLHNSSPFSDSLGYRITPTTESQSFRSPILHSPVLLIKLIMLRVLYHFNVSPQQSVHQ